MDGGLASAWSGGGLIGLVGLDTLESSLVRQQFDILGLPDFDGDPSCVERAVGLAVAGSQPLWGARFDHASCCGVVTGFCGSRAFPVVGKQL